VLREHHRYGPEHYAAHDKVRDTDGVHFRVRHPEERPEDDFEVRGAVEDGVFRVVEGVCAIAASSERFEVDAERAMLRAKKPLEWRSNLVGEEAHHHHLRYHLGRLFSKLSTTTMSLLLIGERRRGRERRKRRKRRRFFFFFFFFFFLVTTLFVTKKKFKLETSSRHFQSFSIRRDSYY